MSSHVSTSLHAYCPCLLLLLLLSLSPFLLHSSVASSRTFDFDSHSQPQPLIDFINSDGSILWNATINPLFYERPYSFVQSLCGTLGLTHPASPNSSYLAYPAKSDVPRPFGDRSVGVPVKRYEVNVDDDVPVEYDARQARGAMCPSLWDVRNQGNCGSCCETTTAYTLMRSARFGKRNT